MTYNFGFLLPPTWETKIDEWLAEDVASFDYAGFVVDDKVETAYLYCKANGVLAGAPFVSKIFEKLGCHVIWNYTEGQMISGKPNKVVVATVTGPTRNILMGERVALNLIARASGIATRARAAVELAQREGFKGCIAGTRKTTPGFRLVEKYAIIVGGCDQHRFDLSSMVMLKDNHIASCGDIEAAVKKAKRVAGFALKIEVECRSQQEAELAITAGADIVMLDNFDPSATKETAQNLKAKFPHVLIEVSGGITLENLSQYFSPFVDIISMGSLTQGVPHVDFSLKIPNLQSKQRFSCCLAVVGE